jgi:ADP-heptose:LPS heptosyltransferase
LPLVMGLPRPQDVPWNGPYLKSDPENRVKFADVIQQGAGKLKVGLAWAGRASPRGRSIPLSSLAPLASERIQFYSLQIGEGSAEAKSPPAGMNLIDATARISDFADSAALIDQMDLIVCIDTAAAQLAGALGKPVWILLRRVPDWRWMIDRADTPWYPTAKLFRQETAGDWRGPIAKLAEELKGFP